MTIDLIFPDWPIIKGVKAASSTRHGGVSLPPYDTLNLGGYVGDQRHSVYRNRELLLHQLGLNCQSVQWLQQVHGDAVYPSTGHCGDPPQADAAVTSLSGVACGVMTADCLPVLFAAKDGNIIAAAHAGWRGLHAGILESTLDKFAQPQGIQVWLGPAIGPSAFEVGEEVRADFLKKYPTCGDNFCAGNQGKWYANLYGLARHILAEAGVSDVYGGHYCTYSGSEQFFSYRREGVTGRMATLIWKE